MPMITNVTNNSNNAADFDSDLVDDDVDDDELEDIEEIVLKESDLLQGYFPNDSYNNEDMENGGTYLEELS